MATYKVIQDIEAEDKLVGPLTFRQFVYAGIAALFFYLSFVVVSKGAAPVAALFAPVGIVSAFFAWPFSRDQPTEVWALARIKFLILPRKRVWDQSGMKELVTVTAPKKIERILTNGLSQTEVKSRLRALADTIDSRGWAIKNVNVSMVGQPALVPAVQLPSDSDRLVDVSTLPQPVEDNPDKDAIDMMDEQNSKVAQHLDSMIAASTKAHRQEVMNKMQAATMPVAPPPPPTAVQPAPQNDYWFLNQPSQQTASVPQDTVTFNTQVVAPGASTTTLPVASANPTLDEETFIKNHRNEPAFSPNMHGHLHVIQPLSAQQAAAQSQAQAPQGGMPMPMPTPATPAQPPVINAAQNNPTSADPKVTQARDTAILDLARNDDLNVATIAREAQKRSEPPADEVVISLH
jgi:hypothetical protein